MRVGGVVGEGVTVGGVVEERGREGGVAGEDVRVGGVAGKGGRMGGVAVEDVRVGGIGVKRRSGAVRELAEVCEGVEGEGVLWEAVVGVVFPE